MFAYLSEEFVTRVTSIDGKLKHEAGKGPSKLSGKKQS